MRSRATTGGDSVAGEEDRLEIDLDTFRLQIGYQNPLDRRTASE